MFNLLIEKVCEFNSYSIIYKTIQSKKINLKIKLKSNK